MNTNQLKRFAKEARIKLMQQVGRKLEFVLTQDVIQLRGKEKEIAQLREKIKEHGKEQLIETVAYTWFNRLMALRFMDANGYNIPQVVTPMAGMTNPELLQNALGGNIETELRFDRQRLDELLDGKAVVADAHTEAYKLLLVATCNRLFNIMPFMFERISDYTELLLPDDLLSDYSIVADIRNGMSEEDCKQEELIGWIYQFYITDKKDSVFEALKKNIKITPENIPAATQLFTPRWIVRYMVENTLGKLWLSFKPNSKLREHMPYYIEAPEGNEPSPMPEGINGITEITFLDPCTGSGHILVYAFELFIKIYEEEGYNTNEIPALILQHNLFGIDIDQRAAQLAAFALTMKARNHYSRFLRKPVQPQIIELKDINEEILKEAVGLPVELNGKIVFEHSQLSLSLLTQAKNYGSLILILEEELNIIKFKSNDLFYNEGIRNLHAYAKYLSKKYYCVVTNPPYMAHGGMNDILKVYLDKHFQTSKADLMTCFMERAMRYTLDNGYWSMVNLPSWMFLNTFEAFRKKLVYENTLDSMLHLGRGIFGSDFGSVAFSLQNRKVFINEKGVYRRLFKQHVQVRTVESIKKLFFDSKYGYFLSSQKEFEIIPGSPIGYWISDKLKAAFSNSILLKGVANPKKGLATTDNNRFLRQWFEVSFTNFGVDYKDSVSAKLSGKKWFPLNKGGEFRKWYGNKNFVINWFEDGKELKNAIVSRYNGGSYTKEIRSEDKYFKDGITWSALTSSVASFRYTNYGAIFDSAGSTMVPNERVMTLLGLLNTHITKNILLIINPTLNFGAGTIANIPILLPDPSLGIDEMVKAIVSFEKEDWDSFETSWNFVGSPLIAQDLMSLEISLTLFCSTWKSITMQVQKFEEKINRIFIDTYSLDDEVSFEVPLNTITLTNNPHYRYSSGKIESQLVYEYTVDTIKDLISYFIGCMFGRYSLDKPALILANQGDSLQDYLAQIPEPSFMPDEDNIIPVLDGEWFTDDIVGRFKVFLKAAFSEQHLEENLKFIETTIGKDIRKYFVKDFYNDHIKRYKKRPIYWMFSSPKGHFKALMYMHRYQPDVCSKLLNDYLQAFISKLEAAKQSQTLFSLKADITGREKILATKEIEKFEAMLKDCRNYEQTLFIIATQKIVIDLDDGVKVNYQKFKEVLVPIKGLEKEED